MVIPALMVFITALVISSVIIPLVKKISFRLNFIAQPRVDRWHRQPTPTLGGLGIFIAFLLSLTIVAIFTDGILEFRWEVLIGSMLVFLFGLYDDYRPMSPVAKLVSQILAATIVISLGYTSTFFTPRISNPILAQLPNILLTYLWLVGITNAINLLDNMDGLAGGIVFITALVLGYFFWGSNNMALLWVSLALAGSVMGFLFFNFPPASIFMGDSGSLFIGFTLATLAIAQQQQASNVLAVIAVPTLLFLLPILDTTLVTFTRLIGGLSPAQGGRDHTSHRLIAFGLNERQALFVMFSVAFVSAVLAASLESLNYWLSLALAPILIIALALFTAYLGRLKMVSSSSFIQPGGAIARIMFELTFRRRFLEVVLDFFLIGLAYYLAFLTRYGLVMNDEHLTVYLQSLPLALASSYIAFFALGIYRGIWRYVGFEELVRYFQAALGSTVLFAGMLFLFDLTGLAAWNGNFSLIVITLYTVFLFLGLSATRSSFKILDLRMSRHLVSEDEQQVLIYGAGDAGEMAVRWILMNPQLGYRPIGFLDDDPFMRGRKIHGVEILGLPTQIDELIEKNHIDGVIFADTGSDADTGRALVERCRQHGFWVRNLRLEFSEIVDGN